MSTAWIASSLTDTLAVTAALVTFPLRSWSAFGPAPSPERRPAAITYLHSRAPSPQRKVA